MTTTLLTSTFFASTPESRPDFAREGGTWRVADADPLRAELGSTFYVEHHRVSPKGAKRLFVGHRTADAAELARVRGSLKAAGFSVRAVSGGLVLTDAGR